MLFWKRFYNKVVGLRSWQRVWYLVFGRGANNRQNNFFKRGRPKDQLPTSKAVAHANSEDWVMVPGRGSEFGYWS
jgi:hypothetical protein